MKIKKTGDRVASSGSKMEGASLKKNSVDKADFLKQLNRVESKAHKLEMEALVQKIIEQGERLAQKKDLKELRSYRKLISGFMDRILSGAYEFTRNDFVDKRGRHKVYSIIRKVNSELDMIAKDLIESERKNIDILQKIDTIKGLILDIEL